MHTQSTGLHPAMQDVMIRVAKLVKFPTVRHSGPFYDEWAWQEVDELELENPMVKEVRIRLRDDMLEEAISVEISAFAYLLHEPRMGHSRIYYAEYLKNDDILKHKRRLTNRFAKELARAREGARAIAARLPEYALFLEQKKKEVGRRWLPTREETERLFKERATRY